MTTKKRIEARGPAFVTGGLRRPRGDLVEWPPDSTVPSTVEPIEPKEHDLERDDVHGELARAKREIRRLLGRVQELSEENDRLRRELAPASRR